MYWHLSVTSSHEFFFLLFDFFREICLFLVLVYPAEFNVVIAMVVCRYSI